MFCWYQEEDEDGEIDDGVTNEDEVNSNGVPHKRKREA